MDDMGALTKGRSTCMGELKKFGLLYELDMLLDRQKLSSD